MDPLIMKNAVRVSICHTVIANGFMQVMMLLINRCMTHANLQWDNLETGVPRTRGYTRVDEGRTGRRTLGLVRQNRSKNYIKFYQGFF